MRSSVTNAALIVAIGAGVPTALQAQQPAPVATEVGGTQLAIATVPAKGSARIMVRSPAFKNGADIPMANTQYSGNHFPGFSWSAGPAGTKTYVLIMQDPDAMMRGAPILHWTMVDIPGNVTTLDAAMTAPPTGASYGPNMRGANQSYLGPHTPAGPKHRYHVQLFALDTTVGADAATTYAGLVAAMKDHVLASGEMIGLGSAP